MMLSVLDAIFNIPNDRYSKFNFIVIIIVITILRQLKHKLLQIVSQLLAAIGRGVSLTFLWEDSRHTLAKLVKVLPNYLLLTKYFV